jgi:hypothetical protein
VKAKNEDVRFAPEADMCGAKSGCPLCRKRTFQNAFESGDPKFQEVARMAERSSA